MDLATCRKMLAWSLVINYVILVVWFVVFVAAHDQLMGIHQQWFKLSAEQFDSYNYLGMAIYKIGIILFNLVPYISLHIVTRRRGI